MLRRILPLIILGVLGFSSQAQYKPVVFGMRAAANLGWMKPDAEGYVSDGVRPGFTWGFIGEFFIMENYAIVTGFNVNFNGSKLIYPAAMDIGNDTVPVLGELHRQYNLKYLQIPLCLKMQAGISEKLKIYGKIGMGTAFNLSSKATDTFVYDAGQEDYEKKNVNDDIALMRQSLIVGAGLQIQLKGSAAVQVELIYDNAFNNILTGTNSADPTIKPRAFHNYVELGAGILF